MLFREGRDMGNPQIQIKDHNGKPAIAVNGEILNPQTYRIESPPIDPAYLKRFVDAGIRLYFVDFNDEPEIPEQEHFAKVDAQVERLLDLQPNLYMIPSIRFYLSKAWAEAHPEALALFEDGTRDHYMNRVPEQRYSIASPVWEAEVARVLKQHVRHFETSSYRDQVIGYHVRCGHCGEWNFWWDIADNTKHNLDYSPGMIDYLRSWLRKTYQDDVQQLQAAWADPKVTFANAVPPDITRRNKPSSGEFFVPDHCAQVLDYIEAQGDVAAERAVNLCRVAKEACDRPVLAGVFNGGFTRAIGNLLRSPYVDFLASPPPYENRGPGDYSPLHTTTESISLHGKIWISEADNRSHLTDQSQYGATRRKDWALADFRRDFLNMLVHGCMSWWYDFSRGWYDDDDIQATFARLQRIARAGLDFDRASAAQVALVVHRAASKYTSHRVIRHKKYQDELGLEYNVARRQVIQEMGRAGFPHDFYSLFDLGEPGRPSYKVHWFLNAFALTAEDRAAIDALKHDNNLLVFVYAPGWIKPEVRPSAQPAYMKEVTGFDFEVVEEPRLLISRITEAGAKWLESVAAGIEFGKFERPMKTGFEVDPERPNRPATPFPANPVFYPQPGEGQVLAEYTFDNKPSMVMRQFDNWTSLYIGATAVPASIVRAIACKAGVHIYDDQEDILYANRNFVGLHTCRDGEHRVVLPEKRSVVDAYTGKVIAEATTEIKFQAPEADTRIFFTGSTEECRAFLEKLS